MAAITPRDSKPLMDEPAEREISAKREQAEGETREMGLDAELDDKRRNEQGKHPKQDTNRRTEDAPKMKAIQVKGVFKCESARK
jgi:hypothetical protein